MDQASSLTQQAPLTAANVPELPALRPGVELSGEMQGSGFEDRQWLLANGERTLEEIAQAVTAVSEWMVSADNVRYLIQTKLMPMGLVTDAAGDADTLPRESTASPLSLMLRTNVLSPRFIDPVTKILQFLYAPLILIPVLVIIGIAHWWLYFSHGILGSILDVLATPGLLLVVVAIIAASGIIHEFGHAAALRYGGGKVRAMGMGLYLIYPAFYTDTTDSYRLGRWARVRTDLGGFYFHLIFAHGIIGLYLLTGREFLLLVVLLINFDIMYQLLPFVRFDGYWALADLTGIPDFFSQMRPFLASVLPVPGWKGSKLPNLKPWAKWVFFAYIFLTLPVLGILLFLTLRRLPTIIMVIWGSLMAQANSLTTALGEGNILGVLAALAQMLILALPLVGIIYMLYRLSWKPGKALWQWSRPTLRRKVITTAIASGVVGLLAYLWVPQLVLGGQAVPPGVHTFEITDRNHTETPVVYEQNPPVGGNHAPVWQNCGFYDQPISDENAVHSLEHGAVWITYTASLTEDEVRLLQHLANRYSHLLVSPRADLPSPIVASAWGRQLQLTSANDYRLDQFVRAFHLGNQAPESGQLCTGGTEEPSR